MKIGMQARLCLSTKGSWLIQASAPPLPPAQPILPTLLTWSSKVTSSLDTPMLAFAMPG